jgi:Chalcone isomerase-like
MSPLARSLSLLALALPLVLQAQPAAPATAGAVAYESSFFLVGHKVKLNGLPAAGADQTQTFAAGLYLVKPSRSLADAMASPGPKRLQMQMLREVESQQLGKMISQSFTAGVPRTELAPCLSGLAQLGQAFGAKKKLVSGDQVSLDWVQTQGTHILINNQRVGLVEGPAFFNCVLSAFVGTQGPDAKLRAALLNPQPSK